jgi:F0F1-type ATP synthase membrane subunit b/b'
MYISQEIFLFLIGTVVLLAITLAVIASSYILLLLKLKRIERARKKIDKRLREHATILLHEAHKKAMSIITNAYDTSKGLLRSTKDFTQGSTEQLTAELEQVEKAQEDVIVNANKQFTAIYQTFVSDLEKNSEKVFQSAVDQMEQQVSSEVDDFKTKLLQETIASHRLAEQKVKEASVAVEQEIAAYKTEKMKGIDEKFSNVLTTMAKEVLGKSLSLDDHRDLVLWGLGRAKEDLDKLEKP